MKKIKENIYSISAIIIMLDQIIKLLIRSKMALSEELTIIPNFFSLYYVENTGAAFSILKDKTIILVLIALVCLLFLDRYITKIDKLKKLEMISLGLIIGGILGNLIDRLLYESVTDYLSFTFFSYNFPVFNIADIAITIGVIFLIISTIQSDLKLRKTNKIK